MTHTLVDSGHIQSIGWVRIPYIASDADKPTDLGVLDVSFKNGKIYRYYDVPRCIWLGILHAPSVGAAFNLSIKASNYPTALVRDRKAS